jgi:DNA mismatch repair protein MSH4
MASRPTRNATSHPWTSQSQFYSTDKCPLIAPSRPTTARPQTATSVRYEGSYVAAVLECRGVFTEIGIATLDKDTGKVVLVQVCTDQ